MARPHGAPSPASIEPLETRRLFATYFVAPTGSDSNPGTIGRPFQTIQHAINVAAQPGDSIEVRAGTYHEMLTLNHSGSAAGGFITLEAYDGEHVLLSGKGAMSDDVGFGNDMIQIINQSYIKVIGFDIAQDSGVAVQDDAFGIRIQGSGSNIVISHNVIHDIKGQVLTRNASDNTGYAGAGIHVYGSSITTPYSDVIIDGNTLYDCQPGDAETETLTVNGNVTGFQITNNLIHDCNNIGIDMIGGEADVFGKSQGTQNLPVARDGICTHNRVYNIHANYSGGYAAGIYVDGGQNITLADNVSSANDMGLEVGVENKGYRATGITVEDNILSENTQAGLVLGGYQKSVGRVENCIFRNNTVYGNDTQNTGSGQLLIQYASSNIITNNIFDAVSSNWLIGSAGGGNLSNLLNDNLYFANPASNAEFDWNAASYNGFNAYAKATGEDQNSLYADPKFVNPSKGNFHLSPTSPATHRGSGTAGQYDPINFTGAPAGTPPDIGAY
jgi:hypothetical protein